jgi:hypothetical protein
MNQNPLEILKIKPKVEKYEPVEIIIKKNVEDKKINKEDEENISISKVDPTINLNTNIKPKTKQITIVDERKTNNDYDREALKKKLLESKMSKVTIKMNEIQQKEKTQEDISKSPLIRETQPINKAKKITKRPLLIIQEEGEEEKEEEKEEETIIIKPKVTRKRQPKPEVPKGVTLLGPNDWVEFGDTPLSKRLPIKEAPLNLKVSSYYMNNREIFINFINSLFEPYRKEVENEENVVTCDNIGKSSESGSNSVSLMTHQKLIRDYMNLYTPYRGLLLYHGLGAGKTCSSIAIAEGMKTGKRVIVMTPASLRRNYFEELKKCGDLIYKKNQYWEWIPLSKNQDMNSLQTLSSVLNLTTEYIKRKKGAWLVNVTKKSNYAELSSNDKKSLDEQIDEMIQSKYTFINYNGLRRSRMSDLTSNFERNLFDNSVVIIDEAHNFISRIVNKLGKEKDIPVDDRGEKEHVAKALSLILYDQLLRAQNCRVVLLTGTPIINYPNEIGILFNILRGYIKTWEIPLIVKSKEKINLEKLQEIFLREKVMDYIDYSPSSEKLLVTRNPFGFKNKIKENTGYHGVSNEKRDPETGKHIIDTDYVDDIAFEKRIVGILRNNEIDISPTGIKIHNYTALPEKLEDFMRRFIDDKTKSVKDINVFKRRILGLTSYFRSADEELLPRYEKTPEYHHVINIPMSDYQFKIYESARREERKIEKMAGKKGAKVNASGLYEESTSTYRIFSRLFCNFVMPEPPGRPLPRQFKKKANPDENEVEQFKEILLQLLKEANKQDLTNEEEGEIEGDEMLNAFADKGYEESIQQTIQEIKKNSSTFLSPEGLETYSPKFLRILDNIIDPEHKGLHLVYSQFRTLEGIGIFSMVLDENGFTRFKIKKSSSGVWEMDIKEEDKGKPTYALYTGTETAEEKEIIRNIYNGDWDYIPTSIASVLKSMNNNNNMGEVIKILMITSSGSEGINLRNTRYVHIMDPYWHPVRTEQVIGRARRICSHKNLPPELQTVEVFIYLMTFTDEQKNGEESIELKLKDLSKREPKVPLTSDEALYEISTIKEEVNTQLITAIKESAIDCSVYAKKSKEGLKCLTFGEPSKYKFSYTPNIENQQDDVITQINKKKIEWVGKSITIQGIKYVSRKMSNTLYNIYDLNSYNAAINDTKGELEPRLIGTLEIRPNGEKVFKTLIT